MSGPCTRTPDARDESQTDTQVVGGIYSAQIVAIARLISDGTYMRD
jgi:hypothetical protein